MGGSVEGAVPSLGRRDEGKINLKVSKYKLCSNRRCLILFLASHYRMSGLRKLFL